MIINKLSNSKISKLMAFIFAAVIFIGTYPVYAFGESEENTIYVIGNSDEFPAEYYNAQQQEYNGIMPDLLEIISEKTKYNFIYLSNNSERIKLAENCQGELVSACINSEFDNLEKTDICFQYKYNNEEYRIAFAFTEIADDEFKKEFISALSSITEDEKNQILINSIIETDKKSSNHYLTVIISALFAILICVVIAGIIIRINNKSKRIYCFNTKGIYNYDALKNQFDLRIKDSIRKLYSVICIDLKYDYVNEKVRKNTELFSKAILKLLSPDDLYGYIGNNKLCIIFKSDNSSEKLTHLVQNIDQQRHLYSGDKDNEKFYTVYGAYNLTNNDRSFDEALKNAISVCKYTSIRKDTFNIYSKNKIEKVEKETAFKNDAVSALNQDEFNLSFQQILNSKSGKPAFLEISSRWDSLKYGYIKENEYINILRENGKIKALNFKIFELACKWVSKRISEKKAVIPIMCSFSRQCFYDSNFIDKIDSVLKKTKCPAKMVLLQIDTSHKQIYDPELISQTINELHHIGIKICLNSDNEEILSFQDIVFLDADYVKFDDSMINLFGANRETIIMLGFVGTLKDLDINVIGCNIETQMQKETAVKLGADFMEGTYCSMPMDTNNTEKLLDA